ncbi:MAG: sensor histidine kinase, partial [Pseudomonadota bacterium]|nr:sensor histidine kinase [Pseudomonadota bacterium]
MLKWQRLFENNERLFWVLHTVGWAGFAVVYYIGSFLHEVRPIFLFIIILNSYAGWILTIPLRYIFRWARKQTVGRLLFTVLVS